MPNDLSHEDIQPLPESTRVVKAEIAQADCRDLRENHRLEAQLLQIQKMEAMGAFAGGIAHDFNNLLMVISAYAELTLDALAPEDRLRGNLAEILQASRRAAELTRQLLTFSRKPASGSQSVDLNTVLNDLHRMLPRLLGEDIHLGISLGSDVKRTRVDPAQIEQVVLNLVSNARDAMPEGGELKIETCAVHLDVGDVYHHPLNTPGDYTVLSISDSGQGIAPEHLPHIFEPFYTTKPKDKGTGLGLATAYAVVKQSGGYIWVYSERGLGTTFKIYLPIAEGKSKQSHDDRQQNSIAGGSETVLLVEDETAVRYSERDFLQAMGYTVLEAANAEDALEIAGRHPGVINLVITDIVLPKMNGSQLAQQISLISPQTRFLFVSGYGEATVRQHGFAGLHSNFLEKPFPRRVLAAKIRAVLDPPPNAMAACV